MNRLLFFFFNAAHGQQDLIKNRLGLAAGRFRGSGAAFAESSLFG